MLNKTSDHPIQALKECLILLDTLLKESSYTHIYDTVTAMASAGDLHTLSHSSLLHMTSRIINSDLFISQDFQSNGKDKFSYLTFPLGLRSTDHSTVLGQDGFLFLTGGSNDVIGQYSNDCTHAVDLTYRWIDLLNERLVKAEKRQIDYFHFVVPEKISILPEYFPRPIATPTALSSAIEAKIAMSELSSCYLSIFEIFNSAQDRARLCKRYDSHLSAEGSFLIFQKFILKFFAMHIEAPPFAYQRSDFGDLAYRMLGIFLPEPILEAAPSNLPEFTYSSEKFEEEVPPQGHRGRRQVWRNANAPLKQKIIVFGNSYFGFVEGGQSTLAWWFSKWFQEFHFIWSNEVDWEYVDARKPDIVLSQVVERFLPVIPAS